MMPFYVIIIGLVSLGLLAIYLPHLFDIQKEKLTRDQLIGQYPEFKWLESDLIIDTLIFIALMIGVAGAIYLLQTPLSLGLYSIVFAGLALFDGILMVKTGICRVPYPKLSYQYVYDKSLDRLGWNQIFLSVFTITTAIAFAVFGR
jgi:hypothetical protein